MTGARRRHSPAQSQAANDSGGLARHEGVRGVSDTWSSVAVLRGPVPLRETSSDVSLLLSMRLSSPGHAAPECRNRVGGALYARARRALLLARSGALVRALPSSRSSTSPIQWRALWR